MNALNIGLKAFHGSSAETIIKYGDYAIIRYGRNCYLQRLRSGFWYENEPLLTIGL